MPNRNNLSQRSDEVLAFLDKNPADTGRKGRDVSNEPRVPQGNPDGGEWTTGSANGTPQEFGAKCPNGYDIVRMLVTGYTDGQESTGKNPGDPGYARTASGAKSGLGTIAASKDHAFGTRMYVPGYGWGTVQDRGGKIKRNHIDLWFERVEDANNWGKRRVNVVVCKK